MNKLVEINKVAKSLKTDLTWDVAPAWAQLTSLAGKLLSNKKVLGKLLKKNVKKAAKKLAKWEQGVEIAKEFGAKTRHQLSVAFLRAGFNTNGATFNRVAEELGINSKLEEFAAKEQARLEAKERSKAFGWHSVRLNSNAIHSETDKAYLIKLPQSSWGVWVAKSNARFSGKNNYLVEIRFSENFTFHCKKLDTKHVKDTFSFSEFLNLLPENIAATV